MYLTFQISIGIFLLTNQMHFQLCRMICKAALFFVLEKLKFPRSVYTSSNENAIFGNISLTTISWLKSESFVPKILRKIKASKLFYYCQIPWGFMTCFVKFHMFSKDAFKNTKTNLTKTSLMRAFNIKIS